MALIRLRRTDRLKRVCNSLQHSPGQLGTWPRDPALVGVYLTSEHTCRHRWRHASCWPMAL